MKLHVHPKQKHVGKITFSTVIIVYQLFKTLKRGFYCRQAISLINNYLDFFLTPSFTSTSL